ncbi:nitroreductase family protein [Vibrio sp. FJH11]
MKSLLLKLLSKNTKSRIKTFIEGTRAGLIRLMSKTRFTSSLYYVFFSTKFYREHQSVLIGSLKYHDDNTKAKDSRVLLRRNIHRLEKGLIMRPRRDVFATRYIQETVDAFVVACNNDQLKKEELDWCVSVLSHFFDITAEDRDICKAKVDYFECLDKIQAIEELTMNSVPYVKSASEVSEITIDQLEKLFKQRRSTRWYTEQLVEMEKLEIAMTVAKQAPSACNRQPFKFHVVTSKEMVTKVADSAMGTVGFGHNFPVIIAVVGDLSAYPAERDRHVIYIDGSLVAMQFALALETMGLSSCMINWPDVEDREKRLEKLLGLQPYERTVMLMSVGYADPEGFIPFSHKKDNSDLIKVVK